MTNYILNECTLLVLKVRNFLIFLMYNTHCVNALLPLKFSSRPHPLQSSRIIFPYVRINLFQAARFPWCV
jgi:hypothetical protein